VIVNNSTAMRNALLTVESGLMDNGELRFYSGPIPAPDATPTGVLLQTISNPTANTLTIANGVGTLNVGVANPAVTAGTIGYCASVIGTGAGTVLRYFDVTLTASTGAIKVDTLAIAVGDLVNITSATLTQPASVVV